MSQRREKRLRRIELRVSALELSAARGGLTFANGGHPALAGVIDADYTPATATGRKSLCRRILDFFMGGNKQPEHGEIVEGLKELIQDRESFYHFPADEDDAVFRHDAEILKAAVSLIEGK